MESNLLFEILKFAVRAPSTHNTQPWLFQVSGDSLNIFYNEKMYLPCADVNKRYLYISIGCMLENLKIAAGHFCYEIKIIWDFVGNKICTINFYKTELISDSNNERFFKQIPKRVNARGIFLDKTIPQEIISETDQIVEQFIKENNLNDIQVCILNKKQVLKSGELAEKAVSNIYSKKDFRYEFSKYINPNYSGRKTGIHGYSLNIPLVVSILLPFAMKYLNLGPILSKLNLKSVSSAPNAFLFSGPDTKETYIYVGMIAEKLMLYLQSGGLDTSIFTAMIEDSVQHVELEKVAHTTKRSQFFFCVGYLPENVCRKTTVRKNIKEFLIK